MCGTCATSANGNGAGKLIPGSAPSTEYRCTKHGSTA